jgi:hypothetical protein
MLPWASHRADFGKRCDDRIELAPVREAVTAALEARIPQG